MGATPQTPITYHTSLINHMSNILVGDSAVLPRFLFVLFSKSLYARQLSQWCNMTFTADNLLPSHSCIGVTWVKPPQGFEPRSPAWEADDLPTHLLSLFYLICIWMNKLESGWIILIPLIVNVTNIIKQSGVKSPILFCIYKEGLLNE